MSAEPGGAAPAVTYCATHPSVETELRCGRCERLICPRCMVHTPGGVRCRDCAMLRRPPMYELSAGHYARAAAAALIVGLGLGAAGSLLLPPRGLFGLFGLLLPLLAGYGAGSILAGAITRVTRGKRGPAMQVAALAGVAIAAAVRLAPYVLGDSLDRVRGDAVGIVLVAVAAITAWGRLR
jgi:hypothetical protein